MKIMKVCMFFALFCKAFTPANCSEHSYPINKSEAIVSYYNLPMNDESGRIISTIITSMAEDGYWTLFRKKEEMNRLGDLIEYKVHPLRFLGHIFSSPELKQCMVTIRRDPFKWRGFMGDHKKRGVAKNMHREMKRDNVIPHLYGFCHHVKADYARVLHYVEREDYSGLVKHLIRHY